MIGAVELWINPWDINISGILFDYYRAFYSPFGRFLSFSIEINSHFDFSDYMTQGLHVDDLVFEALSQ